MAVNLLRDLRVLVIDDDPIALEVGLAALTELGVSDVHSTVSAREALQFFDTNPQFHLVMCDVDMPEMDGIEFLRHLQQRQYRGATLLVSGTHQKLLRVARQAARARLRTDVDTLEKPVNLDALAAVLQRAAQAPPVRSLDASAAAPLTAAELVAAIERSELFLEYQPKIELATGIATGCEALVRWRHPTRGLVGPAEFVPVAEREGLMPRVTAWVVEQAVGQLAAWHKSGMHIGVAINLSMKDLDDVGWPDRIGATVRSLGLIPEDITFELTESEGVQNLANSLEVLARLRLRGFGLALDDFGTGFSSLQKLAVLPFTELKIDRAFVRDAPLDGGARKILQAGIELATEYGLVSVAEGIETPEQLAQVQKLGCKLGQGFYFAKSMPADALAAWYLSPSRNQLNLRR